MRVRDAYPLNYRQVLKGSYFVTGNVFESTNHWLPLNSTIPLPVSLNQLTLLFVDPTKN